MEHAILNIVESTLRSGRIDSSIFESVMHFLSFHKIYAANRKLKVNFFIFFESGVSNYHINISKKYKISRRIDSLYGLDREKRDKFFEIIQKNLKFLETIGNELPNVKVIRLPNLEADFIPYYLISRKLVDTSKNVAHIIYSNDHDLLQCLDDNVYVYVKVPKVKKIVKKGQALRSYLKFTKDYPDSFLPLAMAIVGDNGDDVDGIKGIGGKTIEKILVEIVELTGGIENLYSNIMKGIPIFTSSSDNFLNKNIREVILKENTEKLISKNLKLVSFELLSRYLDDPSTTEVLEKRRFIENIIKQNNIYPLDNLKMLVEKLRIDLQGDILDNIYYNGGN